MKEYFTIENCTAEQLEELRWSYFWSDERDREELKAAGIETPDDVPNWIIYQEYAGILFTNDDFWCTAGQQQEQRPAFHVILEGLFCIPEAGLRLDPSDERHEQRPGGISDNRWSKKRDSFYDLDGARLCCDDRGQLYAVEFQSGTREPIFWQRVIPE